ncbi:MAG: two component regulator three y domain-containing protein [bacterium]|nr:two component regulator three y domain-containing protein [bacterium]
MNKPISISFIKKIQFAVVMAVVLIPGTLSAQHAFKGMPFITNFSTDDYQGGIQNWDITQDKRGFIYLANNFGLLEFDGHEWQLYNIDNSTKLRSVHVAEDGRVYVGGQSILGYLIPDENGQLKFKSLVSEIPEEFRNFDDVWKIYETSSGIIFGTSIHLFIYKDDKFSVLSSGENFMLPEQSTSRLILTDTERGIITIKNRQLVVLADHLKGRNVRAVLPYTNNRMLIITYDGDFFLYDEHGIEKWKFPASNFIEQALVNTASILNDGNIALGTQNSGLVILSSDGNVIDNFTVNRGLNNRTINCVYEDNFSNLWVGMNDGISYIERGSPFTHINEDLGLQGIGYAAAIHGKNLYLGTSNGLFQTSQENNSNNPFSFIEGSRGHVNNIEVIGNDLIMSHHDGAFIIDDQIAYQISDVTGSWKFFTPNNLPNTLIEGTYFGFNYYQERNGKQTLQGHVGGFSESSRVIEQDGTGNVWMTHGYKGAYKIRFEDKGIKEIDFYNSKNGFPADILINVFKIQGQLVFGSQDGIYTYSTELDSFIVHTKLDQMFQEENYVGQLKEDIMGNIYFIADNKIGKLSKNNNNTFVKEVNLFKKVNHLLNDDLQNIHCIDLQNVLIGAKDGFIHYNPTVSKALPEQYETYIRQVRVSGQKDSLIFGGNHTDVNGLIVASQEEELSPTLPYSLNNIKFSYSTPYFDGLKNEYSYKLEGFNDKWSEWSAENSKEYTNLHEGKYTFQLRAKNIYGKVSQVAEYSFSIDAPWYRSIAAYVLYVVVFIGVFGISLAGLDKKHKKDKIAMELQQKEQLQQKDSQIHEVTKKSEEEITNLKTQKLQGEIKHKNQELASATMYIINKNEFIHEIKASLAHIVKKKNGSAADLSKIIKDIEKNTNEAEDWKQFEGHFDEVHHGFTAKLREEHPDLTPQEIKLSAYLRMNMTTKEIASLMHISPRGVEIGRYRLRKKLALERSVNLVDFMMNFS